MRILHNAKIYSLDDRNTVFQAIAIDQGRILATGTDEKVFAEFGNGATTQNLGGSPVIPGLTDAHIHLVHYALSLQRIDCEVPTKEECLQRVAERARITPPGKWLFGHGWNQNEWADGFGTAADLDQVAPNHPVYLSAKSLHASWVNSAALKIANINANTPDPSDGKILRDERGQPAGIFFEGASTLVTNHIPEPSLNEIMEAIETAQPVLWKMGITGIHDFDRRECFMALQNLHKEGLLKLRVLKSIPLDLLPQAVEMGLQSGYGDDWLRIGGVKLFTDGALGPHTAAMLQPYENAPDNKGMLLMDAEEIYEKGILAAQNGLSLAIHAIGDRANHETLNALEKLRAFEKTFRRKTGQQRLRHRIEHVQLLHPEDVHRLADLNIIASMQPIHATSDMKMADDYWGKRAAHAYAWRSQLTQGAQLAFGSDAPVESPNPFWGLHAAVTRQRRDGYPGSEGWYPDQRLSVEEALRGFTSGAAFASGTENRLGKLAAGYLADLLVLDEDPFTCDQDVLHQIKPNATMVGGEWVFG